MLSPLAYHPIMQVLILESASGDSKDKSQKQLCDGSYLAQQPLQHSGLRQASFPLCFGPFLCP